MGAVYQYICMLPLCHTVSPQGHLYVDDRQTIGFFQCSASHSSHSSPWIDQVDTHDISKHSNSYILGIPNASLLCLVAKHRATVSMWTKFVKEIKKTIFHLICFILISHDSCTGCHHLISFTHKVHPDKFHWLCRLPTRKKDMSISLFMYLKADSVCHCFLCITWFIYTLFILLAQLECH